MPTFKAIAAMSENRVIGIDGGLPWHLPEDFKWFKETTMGGILVMGRRTFDELGRPLPGRETFVLSRTPQEIPGTHSFTDLEAIRHYATDKTVWIAGGAEIYRQMLPDCAELLLTRVKRSVDGDTVFPPFEHLFDFAERIRENADFVIERWTRKR